MERRAAARAERLRFRAALNRLQEVLGLERRKVAALLGVRQDVLSKMTAERVAKQETLAPPDDWREVLAGLLLTDLRDEIRAVAEEIAEWPRE